MKDDFNLDLRTYQNVGNVKRLKLCSINYLIEEMQEL